MNPPTKPKLGPLANRTEQTPKAQTPKTCRRCERTIEKGERYHLVLGQRGSQWKAIVRCSECHGALKTKEKGVNP